MRILSDYANFKLEFQRAIKEREILVFNYTEEEGLTIKMRFLPVKLRKNGWYWMVDGYVDGIEVLKNYRQLYISNCGYDSDDTIVVSSIKSLMPIILRARTNNVRRI